MKRGTKGKRRCMGYEKASGILMEHQAGVNYDYMMPYRGGNGRIKTDDYMYPRQGGNHMYPGVHYLPNKYYKIKVYRLV